MASHQVHDQPWLWFERIPLGGLTVVATPSGGDASPVVADLAARVTAGLAFPGDNRPHNVPNSRLARRVVVVSAGGDPCCGLTRLIAHSGGLSDQVLVVNGVIPPFDGNSPDATAPDCTPAERSLSLPGDLNLLREKVLEWNRVAGGCGDHNRREPNPVGLLIIESLPVHVEKWREADLRTLFDRLNRLAVELNLALVLLSPLSIDPSRVRAGKVTLARALGSAALVEAAAAVWQIQSISEDPDRYEFLPLKSRKSRLPQPFRLENEAVQWEVPSAPSSGANSDACFPEVRDRGAVQTTRPAPAGRNHRAFGDLNRRLCESVADIDSIPQFPVSSGTKPTESAYRRPADDRLEPPGEIDAAVSRNAPPPERPRPSLDDPPGRTAAEIRQSPEWKRASRIERKRLLRTATARNPAVPGARNRG